MILGFKTEFPDGSPTRFIEKTENGIKKHSIHEDAKDRWKPGMTIEIATGVRTKHYTLHLKKVCTGVQRIEIRYDSKTSFYPSVWIDGVKLLRYIHKDRETLENLAQNDGFDNFDLFCKWFCKDFSGKIIHWTDLKYSAI